MPVGMFSPEISASPMPSRCLTSARIELPWATTRTGRPVVRPPPEHELLVAELLAGLRLVLPLQGPVVPFVQPPRSPDGQPGQAGRVQRDVGGLDCPREHGGVHDAGPQARVT